MKDIIISDTHFGIKQNSVAWLNSQIGYIYNEFIPLIKKTKQKDDVRVIHCGDVFDSRSSINPMVATAVRKAFIEIAKLCDVYIIAGNHDFYSPNEDTISSLDLILSSINNLHIIKNEKFFLSDNVLLLPWYEFDKTIEQIKNDKNVLKNVKYIFCHTDLTLLSFDIQQKLHNITIFSGHIHYPVNDDNLITLGSVFPLTFADCNTDRGIHILDEETSDLQFIKSNNVIKFWRFYNKQIFDFNEKQYENDYVELYIDKLNLLDDNYTKRISQLSSVIHNITVIPNVEQQQKKQDINFTSFNIKSFCQKNIPKQLQKKFDEVIDIDENNL